MIKFEDVKVAMIPDDKIERHKVVDVMFDIDSIGIICECPACLYKELGKRKYDNLCHAVYSFLDAILDYREYKNVEQRKSKKKSRQKDIQKSC